MRHLELSGAMMDLIGNNQATSFFTSEALAMLGARFYRLSILNLSVVHTWIKQ